MNFIGSIAIVVAAVAASPVLANDAHHHKVAGPAAAAQATALTEGEVRKVDKAARKITLKHGPIPNLEMPGMTMVFPVADPSMLDKVKAGDKVRFAADKVGGTITVTRLEPAQ